MTTPSHADIQTEALSLPVLTVSRWSRVIALLVAIALIGGVTCLQFGAERIPLGDVARILLSGGEETLTGASGVSLSVIVLEVRLPRVLLAFLVGASLAAVGVALQALLRNPLADPYILGVSSGAALGAVLALQMGIGWAFAGFSALHLFAFLGAGATIVTIYRVVVTEGRVPVHTLLLAGVIINAIISALILFITSVSDSTSAFRIFFWLMGNLSTLGYAGLGALAVLVAVGIGLLCWQARNLNLLALGEETARGLGLAVERVKHMIFFTSALVTGAVVAVSGLIGFVGMVVPHAIRMVLGADHRLLLPAAALFGGVFLMVADTVARSVLAPTELPVGVITALCGGPFFIYLLIRHRGAQML
jgi:ABC-type Fe3+-siderophore transport system permease subunit